MSQLARTFYTTNLLWLLSCLPGLAQAETGQAIFAGGCFWCMEADFEKQAGVLSVESGYTGGQLVNPDYKAVSKGGTGHYEAVRVYYDPAIISYQELLNLYWRNIDPYDDRGQFCDKGASYRSAIFSLNPEQAALASQSKAQARDTLDPDTPLVTPLLDASEFYPAEDYHQDYYKKNPLRYKYYRWNCGRDQRLEEVWGPQQ